MRKLLGEEVGSVVLGGNVLDSNGEVLDFLLDEVILDINVLGALVRGLILGERDGSGVVLIDCGRPVVTVSQILEKAAMADGVRCC